jgi:hypothetical protein
MVWYILAMGRIRGVPHSHHRARPKSPEAYTEKFLVRLSQRTAASVISTAAAAGKAPSTAVREIVEHYFATSAAPETAESVK